MLQRLGGQSPEGPGTHVACKGDSKRESQNGCELEEIRQIRKCIDSCGGQVFQCLKKDQSLWKGKQLKRIPRYCIENWKYWKDWYELIDFHYVHTHRNKKQGQMFVFTYIYIQPNLVTVVAMFYKILWPRNQQILNLCFQEKYSQVPANFGHVFIN